MRNPTFGEEFKNNLADIIFDNTLVSLKGKKNLNPLGNEALSLLRLKIFEIFYIDEIIVRRLLTLPDIRLGTN